MQQIIQNKVTPNNELGDRATLRGYCTLNQKLACFVLYFKIINTFWKEICASYSKLSKERKK